MSRKKKFKNGVKKAAVAISLAVGPVLVTYGSHLEKPEYIFNIIGILCMCGSLIFGVFAMKDILDGFFDKSNE